MEFVTTEGDEPPTPSNSKPLTNPENYGRGSWVLFNQSSMLQSSETGYGSLSQARAAGHSGTADFKKTAQQAFTTR